MAHERPEAQVSAELVPRQLFHLLVCVCMGGGMGACVCVRARVCVFHLLVRTETPQQRSSERQVGALVYT